MQPGSTLALRTDGYLLLRALLDADAVQALRDRIAACDREGVPMSREVLYADQRPARAGQPLSERLMNQWLNPHWLPERLGTRDVVEATRSTARALLGEPVVLFQDLFLLKQPNHREFPWHQDLAFWPVDRGGGVVLWTALDACEPSSGALQVVRGSHAGGLGPAIDLHTGLPQEGDSEFRFVPEEADVVRPSFDPGDAIAFLPTTWHRSLATVGTRTRRAWAVVWLAASVCWQVSRVPNHPLCRRIVDGEPVGEV